jgi:hydrogenase maturation protease
MDRVRAIADAVLYEGYALWPYTRSALKNQRRWTWGGVFPPAHTALHPDDPCEMRAQVRCDDPAAVRVTVRFLQVVAREADEEYLAWDEATEREVGPGGFAIAASSGARSWRAIAGRVDTAVEGDRLTVTVRNETPFAGDREAALRQTLCSTHMVLRGARFVSATEAEDCESRGCWPVLIDDTTMLCSPIILEDRPRIAPESPGDLFDGGEIDGLLALNILALTDAEKAEMRASDPRTRAILERTEALTEEQVWRLSGYRLER